MLSIQDIIELAGVSRKTIYNAINDGRLNYHEEQVGKRLVKRFAHNDVAEAFPSAKDKIEIIELKAENERLKFALAQMRNAMDLLDPSEDFAKINKD
ncbi:helix-turn-helix domain-containing protein [Vibrio toranzoniae]|nr:helix-turn-helix domain-containing protein [Vibrio toranzoniae]